MDTLSSTWERISGQLLDRFLIHLPPSWKPWPCCWWAGCSSSCCGRCPGGQRSCWMGWSPAHRWRHAGGWVDPAGCWGRWCRVVMMFFVTAATQSLGVQTFTDWLARWLDHLPALTAGLLIVVAGYSLSSLLADLVQAARVLEALPAPAGAPALRAGLPLAGGSRAHRQRGGIAPTRRARAGRLVADQPGNGRSGRLRGRLLVIPGYRDAVCTAVGGQCGLNSAGAAAPACTRLKAGSSASPAKARRWAFRTARRRRPGPPSTCRPTGRTARSGFVPPPPTGMPPGC
jgi:hypothetical protein